MRAAEGTRPAPRLARRRMRALIVAAVLLGLALRLAFAFLYWKDKPLTLDEQEYLLLASNVARGAGFSYPDVSAARTTRHFERPPAFALVLATVLRVTRDPLVSAPLDASGVPHGFPRSSSDVPPSIKMTQAVVSLVGIVLVAMLALKVAGPAAAVAAAILAAVYPPMAWLPGYVLSEPLYSVCALGVVWLLHAQRRRELSAPARTDAAGEEERAGTVTWPAAVFVAGVLSGIGILTKEHLLFFLPLAVLWLLRRRGLVPALLLLLGVALVLTPWVVRNYEVQGRFVLTAAHGGVTFWTGNNALATGEGDLAANPEMGRARVAFERRHKDASADDLDRLYYDDSFRFIVRNPIAWGALLGKKIFYTFVPVGRSYRLHSPLYFAATLGSFGLVLALGIPGLVGLVRSRRASRVTALWLLALSSVVVCVVFFPQERFRIPVLDPTLVVCTAAWIGSRGAAKRFFVNEHDLQGCV